MTVLAPVNRIIPFSAVDGPGNRTAVFVQGCTFNCVYCHNPETIRTCIHCGLCAEVCPAGALRLEAGRVVYDAGRCAMCDACIRRCPHLSSPRIRWMSAEEVMGEVRRNVPFVRGVTVSGGECTLQREFLLELAPMVHAEGLDLLLDSNGGYPFFEDAELTEAVDGVMLDVKAWDDAGHRKLTGVSNENVLHNLSFLARRGKLTEVRTVNVPEWMDARETVRNVCATLRKVSAEKTPYKLIRFRPMGVREQYRSLRTPSDAEMEELARIAYDMGVWNTVQI